jgi:hypothetical protein
MLYRAGRARGFVGLAWRLPRLLSGRPAAVSLVRAGMYLVPDPLGIAPFYSQFRVCLATGGRTFRPDISRSLSSRLQLLRNWFCREVRHRNSLASPAAGSLLSALAPAFPYFLTSFTSLLRHLTSSQTKRNNHSPASHSRSSAPAIPPRSAPRPQSSAGCRARPGCSELLPPDQAPPAPENQ